MIINLGMSLYRMHFAWRKTAVLASLFSLPLAGLAADHKAPPIKPATQYAAFETHANEHVSIAADPCDEPKDCPFFRLEYIQHGFLPVRVIVTNDRDTPISLDDVRMQFLSAGGDTIPAALDEDINRRLFSTKKAMGTKIPLTPITIHHPPVDKKISEDETDFGFPGTEVKAHSTLGGYLFYDVRGLDDPVLKGAQLYVKMVRTSDGKQLFAFTIPFDQWLAAHPGALARETRK